ncbi:MAG: hypothetical protein GX994_07535 [Firmicutes bacterium]|nr:hypothetical protein [Bacillota bacterium]
MFEIKFDSAQPIYAQIIGRIKKAVACGSLQFFIEADRAKVNSNLELEANKISNKITRYTAVYQKGQNPVNIRTSHKDVSVQVH